MVKLVNTKGNMGHGNGGQRIDAWKCQVCGLSAKETGADIFNMPDLSDVANTPEDGKKAGVARWMCGSCLAQALETGLLVLYHNPGKGAVGLEMALPVEVTNEPDASEAFEVSW